MSSTYINEHSSDNEGLRKSDFEINWLGNWWALFHWRTWTSLQPNINYAFWIRVHL